jgi:peroxiredoxin Q/BCP
MRCNAPRPMHRAALITALSVVALSTTACGGKDPTDDRPTTTANREEPTGPLAAGDAAPAITMTLQDGKTVELASLKGKQVLVYFYPKDDTPGCTVEAQGLRDAFTDLQAAGVQVYGVSTQDAASHAAFIDKHDLPFPLVVDSGGEVAKAFRVPVKGEYASRQSFLIGTDGKIKKVWLQVKPDAHAAEVLSAARS